MGWRDTLKVGAAEKESGSSDSQVRDARISHIAQKLETGGDCADCADIAYGDSKQNAPNQNPEEIQSRLMEVLANACKGLEITPKAVHEALSPEDVEDWQRGEFSQEALTAFAGLLVDRRLMDEGKRPPSFTENGYCQQCGPVYLWSGGVVLGCPWCFNRAAGRPIPRPGSVRCGECRHFERITHPYQHPHLGHCAVGEPEAIVGLWDGDRRYCLRYLPTETVNKEQENGK